MKQALNNIDIHAIIEEIRPDITGAHVKNVYQLDDTRFIIAYRSDGNKQLLLDVPNKLHVTNYSHEKPKFPPPFCVSLRKYIKNRRVVDFYQVAHLDRIAVLVVAGSDGETWRLVFEFFGKGNVMLLKPDDTVLVAKRYIKLRNEIVLPNKPFIFPEQHFNDFIEATRDSFATTMATASGNVVKVLTGTYNMNTMYAEHCCATAGLDKKRDVEGLQASEVDALFTAVHDLATTIIERRFTPCIFSKHESFDPYESVEPVVVDAFKHMHARSYPSFNAAVDDYFSRGSAKVDGTKKDVKKKLSKSERILASQLQQLDTLEAQGKEYERLGTLLYQYFVPLSRLLETLHAVKKQGMSWDEISAKMDLGKQRNVEEANLFHGVVPGQPLITVELEDTVLELDIRLSLTENINKLYYGKSKKAKRKIPGARETIEKYTRVVEKERQDELDVDQSTLVKVIKRKQAWFEKYRWFRSSDGYLVIAGRDATSNEALFSKHLAPADLFFHSEVPGAPVVIIKNKPDAVPGSIPPSTIAEAAIFGVSYSRSWKLSVSAGDVYHVAPDQVSKTPQTGEFLPKGSFVIRGERQYHRNVKLSIGIGAMFLPGVIDMDGLDRPLHVDEINTLLDSEGPESEDARKIHVVIVAGPPQVVSSLTPVHAILKPSKDGDTGGAVASRLRKIFFEQVNKGLKNFKFPVDIEDIQACLPPGRSLLVK